MSPTSRRSASQYRIMNVGLLALICLLGAICAQPSFAKSSKNAPMAFLDNSGLVVSGNRDNVNSISYWEGIRYALPPTGNNRFAPPQSLDDVTQGTPAAPSKVDSPKDKKHSGSNAAIGRPPPMNFNAMAKRGISFLNTTTEVLRNISSSIMQPQSLTFQQHQRRGYDKIYATRPGPKCPQSGHIEYQDEDCLYLNVYRPSDSSLGPLPVLLFIHGGGWSNGAGSDFDPTSIIKTSYLSDIPVMVVTINYRLGILGFSASSDLATLAHIDPRGCAQTPNQCTSRDATVESAGLNLGYQDQKLALNWTFSNIAAFGGDPGKITIWGQSAGAFGVSAMLTGHQAAPLGADQVPYQSNPPRPPFRAAIMMSGSPSGPAMPLPVDRDIFWNEALRLVDCDPDRLNTPQARIDCIRKAKWQDLRTISFKQRNDTDWNVQHDRYALGAYPYTPVLDGGAGAGGFFGEAPSRILARGDFARVPLIAGDVEDEGTLFAPESFDNPAEYTRWFQGVMFANSSVSVAAADSIQQQFDREYPDDPVVGSPYNPINGNRTDRFFPGPDNQYKRAASIYGDVRFQAGRRQLLDLGITTGATPAAFSYAFMDPSPRAPLDQGVPHSSDLDVIFGNTRSPLTAVMARQWASFATRLTPNGNAMPNWPQYDHADPGRILLSYKNGGTGIMADTYRQSGTDLINSPEVRQLFNN